MDDKTKTENIIKLYESGFKAWVPDYDLIAAYMRTLPGDGTFGSVAPGLKDGAKADQTYLLYTAYEKVIGNLLSNFQELGDCVGNGWGTGVDHVAAIDVLNDPMLEWVARCSCEAIYALSRVEIGRGRLGNSDGSSGAWAAEAVVKYGTIHRQVYGKYDLTKYRPDLAKLWGRRGYGLPDELEPIAKEHTVVETALIDNWADYCDAIAAGHPVVICSNQGFTYVRDKDGFLAPGRKPWSHCMLGAGADTSRKRPGACIWNSWGEDWVKGPTRLGQPQGSFWADADVVDRMLSGGDSFAIAGYKGFTRRNIPSYSLI